MWQGFGIRRDAEVASVRRHQKLPSCQTEPMPAVCKRDLQLDKAEPTGDTGVTTSLRKGKKCCVRALEKEE